MRKVLVVRFSSIGDIVLTSPVVRCLHRAGDTEVHYLTRSVFTPLLEGNPYISRIFTIEHSIREVMGDLRSERYDMVIDLHRNIRTLSLLLRLRRPFRRFSKLNIRKWLLVRFKWDLMPDSHVVDRYMATIAGIGLAYDGKGLDYFIPPDEEVDPGALGELSAAQYICVSAGSQHATKQLPVDLISAVIRDLAMPVVLLGAEEDRGKASAILAMAGDARITDLTGKLSLNGSASVIRQSAALITGDTGLMHIGAALQKRVVSVWGNTVPSFGMTPFYAPEDKHLGSLIQVHGLQCRPCSKLGYPACPKGHFRCMTEIHPSRIVSELSM